MSDSLVRLLQVMRALRDPSTGCAWDREQTYESIVPHTIEEAYEVAGAVEQGEPQAIREELGDLLFQVVFLAQIASERGEFDFDAVAAAIADKLIRRHPHVFATPQALSADTQTVAWERFKAEERERAGQRGTLEGITRALPALTRASKLGKRAARVGFDWPELAGVRAKVDEELAELQSAVDLNESKQRQAEELGDVLFAISNWARHLGLDPEAALRMSNAKFERRFAHMERLVRDRGLSLEGLDLAAWEALWLQAKAEDG